MSFFYIYNIIGERSEPPSHVNGPNFLYIYIEIDIGTIQHN